MSKKKPQIIKTPSLFDEYLEDEPAQLDPPPEAPNFVKLVGGPKEEVSSFAERVRPDISSGEKGKARDILAAIKTLHQVEQRGTPKENIGRVARLWSAYLGVPVSAVDVSAMMVLLKTARLRNCNNHFDSAVDIAGWGGIAGEVME